MSAADRAISADEATHLFAPLADASALVLAISGGPDSTALLLLAARWRAGLRRGPKLIAITIDHGLRAQSRREAADVGRLAKQLGVDHRILRWTGHKPAAGLQAAARAARYRLLARAAKTSRASHILTAHTLDDQAETVLIRLARGSGLTGLGAMAHVSALPGGEASSPLLVRPLLEITKTRLVATLRAAGISFAEDPSNRDPRFTRARVRTLMPAMAGEGLDAKRLSLLAQRMRRADAALEAAVDTAAKSLSTAAWSARGPIVFAAGAFARQPAEVRLRLLGRAITHTGDEGPVELGKLEALVAGLNGGAKCRRMRRTLAGALVTLTNDQLVVERAPPRRAVWQASAGLAGKAARGRKTEQR